MMVQRCRGTEVQRCAEAQRCRGAEVQMQRRCRGEGMQRRCRGGAVVQ